MFDFTELTTLQITWGNMRRKRRCGTKRTAPRATACRPTASPRWATSARTRRRTWSCKPTSERRRHDNTTIATQRHRKKKKKKKTWKIYRQRASEEAAAASSQSHKNTHIHTRFLAGTYIPPRNVSLVLPNRSSCSPCVQRTSGILENTARGKDAVCTARGPGANKTPRAIESWTEHPEHGGNFECVVNVRVWSIGKRVAGIKERKREGGRERDRETERQRKTLQELRIYSFTKFNNGNRSSCSCKAYVELIASALFLLRFCAVSN